jgi:hypothetical protein
MTRARVDCESCRHGVCREHAPPTPAAMARSAGGFLGTVTAAMALAVAAGVVAATGVASFWLALQGWVRLLGLPWPW